VHETATVLKPNLQTDPHGDTSYLWRALFEARPGGPIGGVRHENTTVLFIRCELQAALWHIGRW
jgi:hypothetical protein